MEHNQCNNPSKTPHPSSPSANGLLGINELGWPIDRQEGARPDDLGCDPAAPNSHHCVRLMALRVMRALEQAHGQGREIDGPWAIEPRKIWEKLGYGADLASLDGRYTRWIGNELALRSQTSAMIPQALEDAAAKGWQGGLIVAPGRVWRRDLRDKIHIGDPRQMDVWILRKGWSPTQEDLTRLIEVAMGAAAPAARWNSAPAIHPYTESGLEVEALWGGGSLEVLECGLASPRLLSSCGLDGWGGLAMGMGLDRLCMLAKGMDDIRMLDDPDPKARAQASDLKPWRAWSKQPGATRDISVAVPMNWVAEQVVDAAAAALLRPEWLEAIDVVGRWDAADLPPKAIERLGMGAGQANWLLRLRLRDWETQVPREHADSEARRAWDALHRGSSLSYRPIG